MPSAMKQTDSHTFASQDGFSHVYVDVHDAQLFARLHDVCHGPGHQGIGSFEPSTATTTTMFSIPLVLPYVFVSADAIGGCLGLKLSAP